MSYSVEKQVAELKAWVGFQEGPNNKNPFSLWHGYGTQFLPWCASFAQFCAVEKGGFVWKSPYAQFGPKGSGYVPTVARDAKHMGIWRDKYARARPGWQVHFDWNWDGTQDHDETVIADDGTNLVTIGGNTSNAVLYRKRDRKYVAGFVALDEAGQSGPPPPPPSLLERTMIVQTHHYDADGKNPRPIPLKDANGNFVPATIIPALDGKSLELDKGASLRNDAPDGNRRKYVPNDLGGAKIIAIAPWKPSDGSTPGGVLRYSDGRPHFVRFS